MFHDLSLPISLKALRTDAAEVALYVFAGGIVMARHRPEAFIDILLTKVSIPPGWTITRKPARLVSALSQIVTRGRIAVVNVLVAVFALVARVAFTFVASNKVCTGSMETGVWSAVVGVCFTVDSLVSLRTGTQV